MKKSDPICVNMLSESEFAIKGHGVHTAYLEMTAALKRRDDIDITVNTDRVADIVHIQTVGLYALRRLVFAPGKKVVSAHIIPDSFVGSLVLARLWRPFATMYLKWFYGRADLVLACSELVRQDLVDNLHLKNRVEVMYNFVDTVRYRPQPGERQVARRKLGIGSDDFVVLGNGQVQPRKRFDIFAQMARQMPDVQFIWVGGIPFGKFGADYSEMNHLIENAPNNLRVTGVIPIEGVRGYLHAADVFVLPSTQENHPMSVIEAAGAGLPIILRDIHEYDDTFRPCGVLMAKRDEDFGRLVERLRSDARLRRTQQRASAAVAERFDSAAGGETLAKFYRQVLG